MDEFIRKLRKLFGLSVPFAVTTMFAVSGLTVMLYMAYRKFSPGG